MIPEFPRPRPGDSTTPKRNTTLLLWLVLVLAMPAFGQEISLAACGPTSGTTASGTTEPGATESTCIPEEAPTATADPNEPLPLTPDYAAIERSHLDWVGIDSLPAELRNQKCHSCNGRYLDPLADVDRSVPVEEADINARATETTLQGSVVTLSGGVEVTQGYRQLRGESATFNRETQSGTLDGNISVREPGVLFRGEHAEIYSESGEATLDDSQFVLHDIHVHGSAAQLHRDDQGLIHIVDGNLSYCAPDAKDWNLRANTMILDTEEGSATARGAKIELGGIPVLYIPWMSFPLDDRRRTGFLWPKFSSDSKGGVDIALPVYVNLAPNYDAMYTPRYIQERGINHALDLRYLNPHIGAWAVGGSFMSDDKRYRDEFPEESNHDRWLLHAKHDGLFEERWRSRVDYGRASDANYLKDLDSSSLETKRQTSLLQLGSLDYLGDDWLLEMEVQQFQSLADDINNDYRKLPQITGSYRSLRTPFALDPILQVQYSNFDTNEDDSRVTGQRLYAEAGAGYPMQWAYGFVNPELKYRQLNYDLSGPVVGATDSAPSTGAALASIDGGLFFERPAQFANKSMVHTLEPRIYYLYSEYKDQTDQPDFDSAELTFSYNQLFRDTRFSGRDRIDDANQMSVGVTTRFIDDQNGKEYLSASLGQIFYFEDRRVRLQPIDGPTTQSSSEVAAELVFNPNDFVSVGGNLLWDADGGNVNAGNIQANYQREDGSIFNAGYTYRRPTEQLAQQTVTEQFHLSTYLPIAANWKLFAALNYSIEADTSIEDMYGLEYDTCCWMIRLLHLRYFDNIPGQEPDYTDPNLERENSTQVQFVLKGMAGFGSRVSGILTDMIRGFEQREY